MSKNIRWLLSRRGFMGGLTVLPAVWSHAGEVEPRISASLYRRLAPPPVTSADQVLAVIDFEPLARDVLPPAHFGYIATGADDDRTVIGDGHYPSCRERRLHRHRRDCRHARRA